MRIALVSEHASPLAVVGGDDAGGQNVHVAALADGLARLGGRVVVHTRRDDPDLPRCIALPSGVVVAHVDAGPPEHVPRDELFEHMYDFAAELHRAWAADPPDVVHSHFWMSGYAAVLAARPLGIPVVHTFHALGSVKRREQGAADTSPRERIDVERDLLVDCDHVVATCTDEVFELLRLGGDQNRISVVPCGVDTGHFAPLGPVAPPRRRDYGRVVSVGRLVARKGIGNAVSAIALLDRVELLVAGGPPPEELPADPAAQRLLGHARALGVEDRVPLLGRVDRVALPSLLRSADVVACIPWYEPFGIVPLEAMACGRPVVASAVGGLRDTVVGEVTGLHVPPRAPEAAADAIARLLGNPRLRSDLGSAGVRRVRTHYRWPTVARGTAAIYARVERRDRSHGERTAVRAGASTCGSAARRRRPRRRPTPWSWRAPWRG
jgi:glycosyltransferase involved in cell wall biosynthesis